MLLPNNIRISPSVLESYRLYTVEDWFDTQRLYDQLSKPFEETEAMLLGRAFHSVIEKPPLSWDEQTVERDGFVFESVSMPRFDFKVKEVKDTKVIETKYGPVTIATKADAIDGNVVNEIKTSTKSIDPLKYIYSVQWKCMCYVFGVSIARFRCFQLRKNKNGIYSVVSSPTTGRLIFGPNMIIEIKELIEGFIQFCITKDLTDILKPWWEREI